jgi:hypothetical protein
VAESLSESGLEAVVPSPEWYGELAVPESTDHELPEPPKLVRPIARGSMLVPVLVILSVVLLFVGAGFGIYRKIVDPPRKPLPRPTTPLRTPSPILPTMTVLIPGVAAKPGRPREDALPKSKPPNDDPLASLETDVLFTPDSPPKYLPERIPQAGVRKPSGPHSDRATSKPGPPGEE